MLLRLWVIRRGLARTQVGLQGKGEIRGVCRSSRPRVGCLHYRCGIHCGPIDDSGVILPGCPLGCQTYGLRSTFCRRPQCPMNYRTTQANECLQSPFRSNDRSTAGHGSRRGRRRPGAADQGPPTRASVTPVRTPLLWSRLRVTERTISRLRRVEIISSMCEVF